MSDKLGPAAHKQKINTFKLLKVDAQVPQCDTCWIVTQEVKSSNQCQIPFCVLLFLSRNHLRKGSVCVSLSCIQNIQCG